MLICSPAWAVVCYNSNGSASDVPFDLSNEFTSENNHTGSTIDLNKTGTVSVYATCPKKVFGTNYTIRSYTTSYPITSTEGEFQYLKLNDYLDGAMRITDGGKNREIYPPQLNVHMGKNSSVSQGKSFEVLDKDLLFRLKVTRSFINMVVIPKSVIFNVYVKTEESDPESTVVYTISYSGVINVPQSCEINAGTTVEFDFGSIGASEFSKAGAGNKPEGVSAQQKTLAIKCSNTEANAYLSMRIETEKAEGNALVSDNEDLGFVVADESSNPLVPNNSSSKIPFRLDDNGEARVGIRAWPVSITGNRPKEGRFTSRGYLRIDYE